MNASWMHIRIPHIWGVRVLHICIHEAFIPFSSYIREGLYKNIINLAKLDDGLAESPTVMVGDKQTKTTTFGKNRGILKPSWAFVETNIKS